ncbi:hypothetical protein ACIRRI_56030, partial [Streptomyces mirabilis]
ELLGDSLPWRVCWYEHDEEEMRAELVAWLLGHAAVRLRESGAPADLQHRIRLLGLTAATAGRIRTSPATATEGRPQ